MSEDTCKSQAVDVVLSANIKKPRTASAAMISIEFKAYDVLVHQWSSMIPRALQYFYLAHLLPGGSKSRPVRNAERIGQY
eukprot:6207699-Pleurochrysis_carterae.AAC.2